MKISLNKLEIMRLSREYDYTDDTRMYECLHNAVQRGFMTRDELIEVAKWKWRGSRTRQLAAENTEEEVIEITRVAFSAKTERLRIGVLQVLRGVNWPMASAVLHFAFPDRYPIIDRRAMKAVGGSTAYTFEKWLLYMQLCRRSAEAMGVSIRDLDRALWVFGK